MSAAADLDLARRAALAAGELLVERFGGPVRGLERKSSGTDMVSDADRDAETVIRELLAAERPADGLLAEEGSHAEATSGRRWVVDPLDGTTNFLYGLPAWSVSIALEDGDGERLVAVVHAPVRGETFTAVRGEGARLGDAPIRVSRPPNLATALVATGFSYDATLRTRQARGLAELIGRVRDVRRFGSAALDLCDLACGRVDGYYERGLAAWDWAAGGLIAAEAGAVVEALAGEPAGLVAAPGEIAAELGALAGAT